jgi:hypothetical protein
MILKNEHELTQMMWEVESLIAMVEQMCGKKKSNEIREGQNEEMFPKFVLGIRKHLLELEKDFVRHELDKMQKEIDQQ